MHQQLLQPDTLTPFRSQHDILARLLPYHVWAEPDPPPEGTQKGTGIAFLILSVPMTTGYVLIHIPPSLPPSLPPLPPTPPLSLPPAADGLLESVARVLLSRSHGLISRYQQLVAKDAAVSLRTLVGGAVGGVFSNLGPYYLLSWVCTLDHFNSKAAGSREKYVCVSAIMYGHTHTHTHTQLEREAGMQACLDRLFIETEHEREEQERLEKQQAEQIAAGGGWGRGGASH